MLRLSYRTEIKREAQCQKCMLESPCLLSCTNTIVFLNGFQTMFEKCLWDFVNLSMFTSQPVACAKLIENLELRCQGNYSVCLNNITT